MQPVSLSLLLCLCLLLATSWAAPSPDSQMTGESVRLPRATCDLLSVNIMGNSLGHSACAAHCLALRRGFRGGRCRDGVCHCRK